MPTRTAKAEWLGGLKEGRGTMRMASGAYEGPYSFMSRFEEGQGTNPEELIAAAHAGCFSMAFAGVLGDAGFSPKSVATSANVSVEPDGDGFTIKRIVLTTRASIDGINEERFQQLAEEAKNGCPVSRLVSGAEISLNAQLESSQQG